MSSNTFEVVLRPDPVLRRLVLCSGFVLVLAGLVLIFHTRIGLSWRCALAIIWLLDGLYELRTLYCGAAMLKAIILDSEGNVAVLDACGDRQPVTLLTGSWVLPGLAWFRLRSRNGHRHAELVMRWRTGPHVWHRLQLTWLQARESFGHPPGP